jgi:oxygen-independent coproporphyrinogen III oxidase
MIELLSKYDIPVPRYTSYPTVPYWDNSPSTEEWLKSLETYFSKDSTKWSMYLHIPFCETLCTFCGCNTIITKDHKRENPYVQHILSEWKIYLDRMPNIRDKELKEVHLGGGTPTFLSSEHLVELMTSLFKDIKKAKDFEASIEVDPRRTTEAQLKALFDIGFRRVSMGVQDFDPEVQRLVNRIQPESMTLDLTKKARAMGYTSVNYDLIYGLPKQTKESIKTLAEKTLEHRPDRIALYSFALVPWIKPTHRLYKDEDLPMGLAKRELYEVARTILMNGGYVEIGMDHFALPTDTLTKALNEKKLHRNFMGYTHHRTDVLLGLGVSSISETPDCFHQNEKKYPIYQRAIDQGQIPTLRGHKLTEMDKVRREQILKLMTTWQADLDDPTHEAEVKVFLNELIQDGLAEVKDQKIIVKPKGQAFLRNICMALDERLRANKPTQQVFSKSL